MDLEDESWNTDLNDHEFMFTHDYLAATKARNYEEIPETKATKLSPCVIVDNLNGAIGRCNSTVSLKSLAQLVGACEVELTPDESLNLTELGVCSNHFNFDHGQLHSSGTKQLRRYTKEDTNHILRLFSSWLFNLSYSQNENKKEEVLRHLIKLLETPELSSSTSMDTDFNLPSPLLVKIAMKINRFDYYSSTDKKLIKVEESRQFGEMLGNTICNS
ncbi:7496_t:CDS:2, partial [Gigaspora rosea]